MKKRLFFPILLIGATSIVVQIILLREFLTVFYGNELSIGITLACWLFWVSAGSMITGRIVQGAISGEPETLVNYFALTEVTLALSVPLSILCVRAAPSAIGIVPGEIIGVLPMLAVSFVILALPCLLSGMLFVIACVLYQRGASGSEGIGSVYILEALGSTIGGLAASFFLVRFFAPLRIMFFIGFLNVMTAAYLQRKRLATAFFMSSFLILFFAMTFSRSTDLLEELSLKMRWPGFELLESGNSIYGNITIVKREELSTVYTNGLYDFTVPDRQTSERQAHLPLLEHPDPKDVLLIGGGSGGILGEVLKHPVKSVEYVELDPLLIRLARKALPATGSLDDPRVHVTTDMDGRLFVKGTDKTFDVIIISLPEPHTAQINRFYTEEFFREASRVLREDGILSFSMSSNPNYISDEQSQLYGTLKNTLAAVFQDVVITPGETNSFLTSRKKGLLTLDVDLLMERLRQRNIDALYMREYYLYDEFSEERIASFAGRLSHSDRAALNRDFHPVAYYYTMVLWSTYFGDGVKRFFRSLNERSIAIGMLAVCIALLLPLAARRAKREHSLWPVLVCVGTTGFAEIGFQIITLIAFQVIYGYVFYKISVILTAFMIGLIIGGWSITRIIEENGGDYALFVKTQSAIAIYPIILPAIFLLASQSRGGYHRWTGSEVLLTLLPVIPGFIGGFQFPLANKLCLMRGDRSIGTSAALTYGIDLFGSCIGALSVALFLIPIIGIPKTCFLVAILNAVGLLLLIFWKRER